MAGTLSSAYHEVSVLISPEQKWANEHAGQHRLPGDLCAGARDEVLGVTGTEIAIPTRCTGGVPKRLNSKTALEVSGRFP